MIPTSFIYAGAELDSASSITLRKYHREGWKCYGHHMTIHFGLNTLPNTTREWLEKNEGKCYSLKVIAIGYSNKAVAALIEDDKNIPCSNKLRHVTISVAPGCNPVDSNYIKEWVSVKEFLLLSTIKIYSKQ